MMTRVRAAKVRGPGLVDVESVALRELEAGEVLVRMAVAGICGSDLHRIYDGYPDGVDEFPLPPGAPGHEGVGRVAVSRSREYSEGDSVLTVPDARWARCFAEYQIVPECFLVRARADTLPEIAILAQQLGTVIFALKRFWPEAPGKLATVIGGGPAGLLFGAMLRRRGFESVIVSDLVEERVAAAGRMNGVTGVRAGSGAVLEVTLEHSGGRGADLVVEASGRDAGREDAVQCVATGGRVGLFGLPQGRNAMALRYDILFERRPTVLVSDDTQHEMGLWSFREALDVISTAPGDWSWLVTHRFALDELGTALELARSRRDGALKVVVNCQ
ncbi:MAG: zinc-binding dehydrogenase [Actinomycetota bacterium]|nr:zinc-binding dehydrogenase [Actinomycetota bacterium]